MRFRIWDRLTRRNLFRRGGFLAAAQAVGSRIPEAEAAPMELGNIYRSIGVRPMINARGTFTIITGSQTLPEVKRAMDEASRSFVNMDELMEGVGKRLAEISGAQWGIVTAGCSAGLAHCTASAVAGRNPERMQKLPDCTGLRNEVIIPGYSRNDYDHAIRTIGVKVVEVREPAEMAAAFNERTAMVYILAGRNDDGPLGTRAFAEIARKRGVPVLVDAAAEILTLKPNVHLDRGATVVAYSGGKCIRGPQAAGLLLGEKAFLEAAWLNSAPHHAIGRSMKAGKEEIMGMLAAVEMWVKRDHKAEWRQWEKWLESVAARLNGIGGVKTEITQPGEGLSNRSPKLTVRWEGSAVGITGQDVAKHLLDTEPRIVLAGATADSISVVPYMMMAGDEKILADRLHATLTKPPKIAPPPAEPAGPAVKVAGRWTVRLDYGPASADHSLTFEQDGAKLGGRHAAEFHSGDLAGTVSGNQVRFRSGFFAGSVRLGYNFTGIVSGDSITGVVTMGEYGEARWIARRS